MDWEEDDVLRQARGHHREVHGHGFVLRVQDGQGCGIDDQINHNRDEKHGDNDLPEGDLVSLLFLVEKPSVNQTGDQNTNRHDRRPVTATKESDLNEIQKDHRHGCPQRTEKLTHQARSQKDKGNPENLRRDGKPSQDKGQGDQHRQQDQLLDREFGQSPAFVRRACLIVHMIEPPQRSVHLLLVNAEPVPHIPVSSLVHIPFPAHLTHEFLPHKFYMLHLQLQLFYYSSF